MQSAGWNGLFHMMPSEAAAGVVSVRQALMHQHSVSLEASPLHASHGGGC